MEDVALKYEMVALLVGLVVAAEIASATPSVAESPPSVPTSTESPQPPPTPPPVVSAEPDPARVLLDEGRASLARGDMTGAVAALRQALRLQPDLVDARASLGLALYGMGNLDGAIDELRAVLRREPGAVSARLTLAAALMARQDWAGARSELEEVVKQRPDTVQALLGLASVRYAQGDLDGAIAAYRRVLTREPEQHDARYSLALILKLARRDAEATGEFLSAAQAGIPKAQYFVGNAYATGVGVEKNLARAIAWWFRAAEQGVAQAEEALAQWRQAVLGRSRRLAADRAAIDQAFREYRAELWQDFPALTRNDDDTVGGALLRAGRPVDAIPVLIREALALSEPAHRLLEALYEQGDASGLRPYDPNILEYIRTAAAEGHLRARLALARIYARGLGVTPDMGRAVALLRATPHEDAQRLLQELSAAPAPTRP